MPRGVAEDIDGGGQEVVGGRDVGGGRAGLLQVQRLATPPHGEERRRQRPRRRPRRRRGSRLRHVGRGSRDPSHGVRQLLLDLENGLRNFFSRYVKGPTRRCLGYFW